MRDEPEAGLRLPTLETAQPDVGSSGWKSTTRRVVSVRIRTVKAWPIDPLDLRNLKLEVSEKLPQG
ncbi:unnamed protein product [Brassica rapa subsp. trilocularis]